MQGLIGLSKNKFFQTLLNLSNFVYLLIGLKTFKMSPNGVNMAVFFLKNCKNCLAAGDFASRPPYMLSCSKCQKRSKCHPNGVKMDVFFLKKKKKMQELPSVWGLRLQTPIMIACSLAHNFHNQHLSNSLLQGFWINKCNKMQLLLFYPVCL